MRQKTAIISGITGQDGAYLAKLLLSKNYKIYGTYRRSSSLNFWRIEELGVRENPNLNLVEYEFTDLPSSIQLIETAEVDEVYNLAAQSFVGVSFDQPVKTVEITGIGALNILEAIRQVNPNIRFYQASTSEMFGRVSTTPQNEETPFHPKNLYGVAKLFAHWATVNYSENYGIFAASGILFNHESPLRGKEFVTRKISDAIAKIYLGKQEILELGNLDATRDWGYAEEYVEGMWKTLQVTNPETYVFATNRSETVRNFVSLAAKAAGLSISWRGQGINEVGVDEVSGKIMVCVNPKFYRPADVDFLIGNPKKAKDVLGWEPTTKLEVLCEMMVKADIRRNMHCDSV